MSDPDRSPFRRFPWVQLVFFLACLAMAAWTWMRHSHAWSVDAEEVGEGKTYDRRRDLVDRFVAVRGVPYVRHMGDRCLMFSALRRGKIEIFLEKPFEDPVRPAFLPRPAATFRGRVTKQEWYDRPDATLVFMRIDARASRFHPASIAGIVVGAMGAFIFGLYLKRWLRERAPCHGHAPASAPGQDSPA